MIWRKACFKSSPLATDSSRGLRSGDVPFSFGSELRCRPSELEPGSWLSLSITFSSSLVKPEGHLVSGGVRYGAFFLKFPSRVLNSVISQNLQNKIWLFTFLVKPGWRFPVG